MQREKMEEDSREADTSTLEPLLGLANAITRAVQVRTLPTSPRISPRLHTRASTSSHHLSPPLTTSHHLSPPLTSSHLLSPSPTAPVQAELETVNARLKAVDAGQEQADASQRAGMEKRQTVLNKELFVLGDVATKEELPRVLHGLSQVRATSRHISPHLATSRHIAPLLPPSPPFSHLLPPSHSFSPPVTGAPRRHPPPRQAAHHAQQVTGEVVT